MKDTKTVLNYRTKKLAKINYTYLVSLPVDWVYHNKLRKGDTIQLKLNKDGTITIAPLNKRLNLK